MTPKEKAMWLCNQYFEALYPKANRWEAAKKCALMAVELRIDAYGLPPDGGMVWAELREGYWSRVRIEIGKL